MLKWTLDVNIIMVWLGLQSREQYERAARLFEDFKKKKIEVTAPDFLLVELTNILRWRMKRTEAECGKIVSRVAKSGIGFVAWERGKIGKLEKLVFEYDLTAYDAIYLLTAQDQDCKLITSDPKLLEAKEWCLGLDDLN